MGNAWREWLKQADYDMDTAESMYRERRYFYSVYMCHLAIEKALKGLYHLRLGKVPPKTQNLIFLLKSIGMDVPEDMAGIFGELNEAQITTRYPTDLETLQATYTASLVRQILDRSKEALEWIKAKF